MDEESIISWKFALGDWVTHDNFPRSTFVIVWREYRETPWTERERYGLMDIADMDLVLHEARLPLERGYAAELTAYDEKADAHG